MPRPSLFSVAVSVTGLVAFGSHRSAGGQCRVNEAIKLESPGDDMGIRFGKSIAVDRDVAIIGAVRAGDDGTGAAYIYRFNGTAWQHSGESPLSELASDSRFGWSVAISGDVAAVGSAPLSGGTAPVFVYRFDGADWVNEAQLHGDDPTADDGFGLSLALDGNVLVVGAPWDDEACKGNCNGGAVYIFRFVDGTWQQDAKLHSSDILGADEFGSAVSVDGDTVLIGSPEKHGGIGSAYIYWYDGTNWLGEVKLSPKFPEGGDQFGRSVALNGHTAAIGSPGRRATSGAVHVFRFVGMLGWMEEDRLIAIDAEAGDQFGHSVCLRDNVILVGAGNDNRVSGYGAAYVIRRGDGGWRPEAKLLAADVGMSDELGFAVALSDTLALVGAPEHADGDGSVYVFGTKIAASDPPCGSIDARQPSLPEGTQPGGWNSIEFLDFNETAVSSITEFAVTVATPGDPPNVTSLSQELDKVTIYLDATIPLRSWTTLTHLPTGLSTRIGYLPADVNADGTSTPVDVLSLIDSLNGAICALPIWSTDVDRSMAPGPPDILRVIDLLNGASAYQRYLGVALPK